MTKHGISPKMLDSSKKEVSSELHELRLNQAQGPCTITFVVMPCLSTDGRWTQRTRRSRTEQQLYLLETLETHAVGFYSSGIMTAILFGFQFCNCSPLSIPSSPYPLFMGRDITTSHVQPAAVWPHALGMLGILAMFLTFFYCHLQWGRAKNGDRTSHVPVFCP